MVSLHYAHPHLHPIVNDVNEQVRHERVRRAESIDPALLGEMGKNCL